MIDLSLQEIADVVGGTIHDGASDAHVSGAAFLDSRDVEVHGLFAAFDGEQVDGHEFARAAVRDGAAAVLGSRPTGVPTIVVPDVRAALQSLAREVLARLRSRRDAPSVIAITGSQGKTSTKDLLARVLSDAGPTVATEGSFNNELGLPLTVLRAGPETRFLILEMGARGIGHLAELCAIAQPDLSLVLNVGKAHLGEFGSQEAIAQAKGEIVEALAPQGIAVLNADDVLVARMAARTSARVVTFGRAGSVQLSEVTVDAFDRPTFTLSYDGQRTPVRLRLVGAHQAGNAAAVAAVGVALGLSLVDIAHSLEQVQTLSHWRMELHERRDGLVVINDAYNANPDSMHAALETLAGIGVRTGRRTIAVLGEMRELGPEGEAEHAAVGALARDLGINFVLTIGPGASAISREVARIDDAATREVESVAHATLWLRENVAGTDVVLVKASRAAGLERVADALLTDDEEQR